jgi:predicted aspartyl protease
MSSAPILEKDLMGRVTTEVRVENLEDLWAERKGGLASHLVRRTDLVDALVDTGATTLALPSRYIAQLGLKKTREKVAVFSRGNGPVSRYDAVRVTMMGRDGVVEVMEVPDDVPPLVGQIPLEMLDLVVDPQPRKLTGNPAHGGEQALELL